MKNTRKWLSVICLALAVCTALPAMLPAESVLAVTAEAADTVKLNKTKATIDAGTTLQLKLKNTTETVTWKSSNTKVATVSKKGLVTAKKGGSVTVTATAGGKSYTCKITVNSVLTASATSVTVKKGKSAQVTLNFKLTGVKLSGVIDNSEIASFTIGKQADGQVPLTIKGKAPGTTVITLSNEKTKDTVKIKVTVEAVTPAKITRGNIQSLYGKTISDANALLTDKMTKDGSYYLNYNFGAKVNSKGKINYLYVYEGSKYSLFGVYPGMSWSTALTTVQGSSLKWTKYYQDTSGIWYTCEKYPTRMLFLKKKSSKVEEVYYYYDKSLAE